MTNHAAYKRDVKIISFFERKLVALLPSANFYLLGVICLISIGCGTTQPPVPVVDRVKNMAPESTKSSEADVLGSQVYTVQRGDTLYAIALNHGVDYKKLVEWNNIIDPNSIKPGQKINLYMPTANEAKPTLYALPQQPVTTTIEPDIQPSESLSVIHQEDTINAPVSSDKLKTSPKALKLPFSEQNVARLQHPVTNLPAATQAVPASVNDQNNTKIESASQFVPPSADKAGEQPIGDWIWPTNGKVLSSFSRNSKGVKISGHAGQPILASAAGVVVYSGNGLRGYGNLIIIKHDDTFLSAYAHNNKLLVKEGEAVAKGQKIAEMGNTDSDTVQLHFEIRKNSKPVDPMEYLPGQS